MMSVAKTMDFWISMLASKMTCIVFLRLSSGCRLLTRSRRKTFSTRMTASSTSAPMAMAMPPSVMVLMVAPKDFITSTVTSSESGMAVSVINVARTLARKGAR